MNQNLKLTFLALIILVGVSRAKAEVLLDLGVGIISDSLKTGTAEKSTQNTYGLGVLFNFKKGLWGGWSFTSHADGRSGSNEIKFASSDTGPAFLYQFGKANLYNLGLAYNLSSKATYTGPGGVSETWDGTSLHLKFGIMPEIKTGFHLGVAINSINATYNKVTIAGVQTSATNTRAFMYPSIQLTKEW